MANRKHLDILAKGVKAWNAWHEAHRDVQPTLTDANLKGANLDGANLEGADLSRANLIGANLTGAFLTGAKLTGAHLSRANLIGAFLNGADLSRANLIGANLTGAFLTGTNLTIADLDGADLSSATLWATLFANVDLSKVRGLDAVQHKGPSTIGIDTIYRSQGKIPEVFLRGAGVHENFITYMRSLTAKAFDIYSCFISYSTKDQEFAQRLYESLQARGVRCWFAPHDMQGGRKVDEQIDGAIKAYEKLLLILSDASMTSPWVEREIRKAFAKEKREARQVLFPISLVPFQQIVAWECLDSDTGVDLARKVREYFIPDFSNWRDHASYTNAFDRLMRDLQADPKSERATTPD